MQNATMDYSNHCLNGFKSKKKTRKKAQLAEKLTKKK